MTGKINSTLRYLGDGDSLRILPLSDDVMRQLKEKHPAAQDATLDSLLFGPIEDVPGTVCYQINGEMVRDVALIKD